MMLRREHILAVAALSIMIGGGSGIAFAQGHRPRTQPITGLFTASPLDVKQRVCNGQDGLYLEIRGLFSGEITSSDPRLAGTLEFIAAPAIVNLSTGLGTFRGRFRIADAVTGKQKAQGEFFTVVTEASLEHGFAVGTLMNAAGEPSDSLFASFEDTFDAALNVSGVFGGVGDVRTPAVVQGGHCSGPFTKIP
jgi:hypothetical protein